MVASRDFCANLLPLYEDCMAHVTSLGQRRRRVIPLVTSAMERPVAMATSTTTPSSPNSNDRWTISGAQTAADDSRLYPHNTATATVTTVTTTAAYIATSLLGVPVLRVDEAEAASRLIERLQQGT